MRKSTAVVVVCAVVFAAACGSEDAARSGGRPDADAAIHGGDATVPPDAGGDGGSGQAGMGSQGGTGGATPDAGGDPDQDAGPSDAEVGDGALGDAPGVLGITGDPAFGIVDVSSNVMREFTITNNGGTTLGPLVVSSSNSQLAAATTGTTCEGATLMGGGACTQQVTFTPTSFGSKTSTLSIGPSGGSNVTADLTGTGRDSVNISASTNGTGAGTITGAGLNCGNGNSTCTVAITRTTSTPSVTLTATEVAATSSFMTWGNDCSSSGAATTCNLTMDAAKTVGATFVAQSNVNLSVTVSTMLGATGSVSSNDSKISNCTSGTCTASYPQNASTMVTLTASPGGGFIVVWGGACAASGSSTTCTVDMGAARTVTAKFRKAVNVVFISSAFYPSTMGATTGVAGGDLNCQTLANAAGLHGTYKAWLSSSSSATTRLRAFNASVRGWARLDGVTFADSLDTLNASGPVNAPNRDENNTAADPTLFGFWSGHLSNGAAGTSNNCTTWTATSGDVLTGNFTIQNATNWQSYFNVPNGCSGTGSRILCMGIDYSNAP